MFLAVCLDTISVEHTYQWPLDDPNTIHRIANSSREFQDYRENRIPYYHTGIDIHALSFRNPDSPKLLAVADGVAQIIHDGSGKDDLIRITETDGDIEYVYEYVHINRDLAPTGLHRDMFTTTVEQGDSLGHVNEWQFCLPPFDHLHFTFQICDTGRTNCRTIDPLLGIRPISDVFLPSIIDILLVKNETDHIFGSLRRSEPLLTVSGDIDIVVKMFDKMVADGMSSGTEHKIGIYEAGFAILHRSDAVSASGWDTVAVRKVLFPSGGIVPPESSAMMLFKRAEKMYSSNYYCVPWGDAYYYVLTNNLDESAVSSGVLMVDDENPSDGFWSTEASPQEGEYRIVVYASDIRPDEAGGMELRETRKESELIKVDN
jgi:hypothetical protein